MPRRSSRRSTKNPTFKILNGRYGIYIAYKKANYKIPKTIENPAELTLEQAREIIASQPAPENQKPKGALSARKNHDVDMPRPLNHKPGTRKGLFVPDVIETYRPEGPTRLLDFLIRIDATAQTHKHQGAARPRSGRRQRRAHTPIRHRTVGRRRSENQPRASLPDIPQPPVASCI